MLLGQVPPVPVENGKDVTLELEMLVPNAASIQLFTPLYVGDATKTDTLDIRRFKVVGKRG